MSQKHEKSQPDRLKEGVSLLTQLKDNGVRQNSMGYLELKGRITEWVKTGISWEGTILFEDYGRVGEVSLPRYNNKAAGMHFKVAKDNSDSS
jgi:hypothetical protein